MNKTRINEIVYLYNNREAVSREAKKIIYERLAGTNRKLQAIELYDGQIRNIVSFFEKMESTTFQCDLILIDFISNYYSNRSSLYCLLSELYENGIGKPWILLNGVQSDSVEIIDDIRKSFNGIKNTKNLKYIHNSKYCEKINTSSETDIIDETCKNIIEDIRDLEKNAFLQHALSGKPFIKTIHIPGFRALNEKKITINLTNKECNSPDYCILGGDYLLNNDDDRISVIFDNLSSLKDVSKLIYTKSRSDKDFLFIKLIEKGNISNGKGKNNNELGITSSIIRDLKIPITILNICFHKIDTTILPEISESAYDAIIKMVEEHADNNSYFKKDIKVIYCHYDIFTKDDQYMQFNNKLEQYLREKNFFLLIHDHTHNITDFKPGNFIHIDRTHEDNKLGIPRIAGGYFDVPPYGSDLYPFYLSFHFIYDEEKKKKFVKYFEFKIWKSKTQSQRDNFVFDGNVTAKFMKKFNKLTNENRKNTESHQGSNQEQKTMLSEKQKYPNQDRNTAMERTTVFVCYSHKNDAYLKRVQVHLKVLKHEGIEADVWDDTRIKAGTEWQKEIEAALASAKVSIMLVSADFLASDFIMNNELPSLLESAQSSGTTILSLIVEPCRFSKSKLSRFQAVNDPDTPLSKLLKPEQEEQYLALIDRITELL